MYEECIATGKPVSAMAPGDNSVSQRKESEKTLRPKLCTCGLEAAVSQQECLIPFHMGQKKMKDTPQPFSLSERIPDNRENKQEERKQISFCNAQ